VGGQGLVARPVPMTASTPRRLAADRELAAALVQASRTVIIITTTTIIIIIISERASE
jgi:hypothetical protein